MQKILHSVTDWVTTKRGMWLTLAIWIVVATVLAIVAPNSKDYQVSSVDALPDKMPSVQAQEKVDEYFTDNEGIPALLVFESSSGDVEVDELIDVMAEVEAADIDGVSDVIRWDRLPPQAVEWFFSEDQTSGLILLLFVSYFYSKVSRLLV